MQQLKKTEEKLQLLRQEQQKQVSGMEKILRKSMKNEPITDPPDRRTKDSEGSEITDRIELLLNEEKKLDEHRLLKEKREAELQVRIKALEKRESLVKEEALNRQRLIKMKQEEDRLEKVLLQKIKADIRIDERRYLLRKRRNFKMKLKEWRK